MKRKVLIGLTVPVAIILMVIVAIYVLNTLPTNSDFGAVYNASVAFVHRIPIYDISAVQAIAAENAGVPVDEFFLALCTNCTSQPVSLSRWFFDSTLLTAVLLALALLIVLSGLFSWSAPLY